jgi:hypothetical protein
LLINVFLHFKQQVTVEICVNDIGMDVAFAVDRWRVPDRRCHTLHGPGDILLCSGLAIGLLKLTERHGRQDCARPGAKVLGGNVSAADFLKVGVHIRGDRRLALPIVVDVLKEVLARQPLAVLYDPGDAPFPGVFPMFAPPPMRLPAPAPPPPAA